MLTSATLQPLLAGLSRTIGRHVSGPEAGAALLESFCPETPMQAMLAAQAIALHYAAMDCFGRAMETAPDDGATITRLQRNAASLTRAFTATLLTLQRCQAKAATETECAWQDPIQREPATQGPLPPASPSSSARQNVDQHPVREPPRWLPSRGEPAGELRPTQHENSGEDPIQREQSGQRPWEELTEAEQFAILYPDRVAAGARSHEDADLWLPRITRRSETSRVVR
jgi:hypothetical protein